MADPAPQEQQELLANDANDSPAMNTVGSGLGLLTGGISGGSTRLTEEQLRERGQTASEV